MKIIEGGIDEIRATLEDVQHTALMKLKDAVTNSAVGGSADELRMVLDEASAWAGLVDEVTHIEAYIDNQRAWAIRNGSPVGYATAQ